MAYDHKQRLRDIEAKREELRAAREAEYEKETVARESCETEIIWADGHEVEVAKKTTAAPTPTPEPDYDEAGTHALCPRCQTYCYGDCTA